MTLKNDWKSYIIFCTHYRTHHIATLESLFVPKQTYLQYKNLRKITYIPKWWKYQKKNFTSSDDLTTRVLHFSAKNIMVFHTKLFGPKKVSQWWQLKHNLFLPKYWILVFTSVNLHVSLYHTILIAWFYDIWSKWLG